MFGIKKIGKNKQVKPDLYDFKRDGPLKVKVVRDAPKPDLYDFKRDGPYKVRVIKEGKKIRRMF